MLDAAQDGLAATFASIDGSPEKRNVGRKFWENIWEFYIILFKFAA